MEALFLLLVFVATFVLALLIGERALRYAERPRLTSVSDPGKVGRYPGCVTCEGAEAVSMAELIRHQVRDHGSIAWQ